MGFLVNFCAGTNREILPGKQVNALLLNVPQDGGSESAIKTSKVLIRVAKPKYFMLDSGGYQLLKAELENRRITYDRTRPISWEDTVNLTPQHVVEVTARLRPDIMTALDFPVRKISDKQEQEAEFMRKLGFNVRWAIETARLREFHCPEIDLFLPVQCYSLEHFELFHESIKGVNFDGFSLPMRNLSVRGICLFLVKFYQIGIKRVHLLGTSAFPTIALLSYLARNYFDWVSLDSTTWRLEAQHSGYLNPHDLSSEYIGDDVLVDEKIEMNCKCPWCKDRTFTYIKNLPYTEKVAFLRCHNYWAIEEVGRDLWEVSGTVVELVESLKRRTRRTGEIEELHEILSIMDACKNSQVDPIPLLS
jgi:queuine/archaeosine tRNA-ribosyltransferase